MGEYLGMRIAVASNDHEHLGYFKAARQHKLVVQKCNACGLMRAFPGTGCIFCASLDWEWVEVSGKGHIYSYQIVTQAIQPAFREWVPYPTVLIELDEQKEVPWRDPAEGHTVSMRVLANLVKPDDVSRPEDQENVAIGKRVKAVFVDVDDEIGVVQFALSDDPPEHEPWRAPV